MSSMRTLCRFHHRMRLYRIKRYIDVSYGGHAPSTLIDLVCDRCGKTKDKLLYDEQPPEDILVLRYRGWSKFVNR